MLISLTVGQANSGWTNGNNVHISRLTAVGSKIFDSACKPLRQASKRWQANTIVRVFQGENMKVSGNNFC